MQLKRDLSSHKLLQLETSDLLGTMRAVEATPGVLDVAVFGAGLHVNVADLTAGMEQIRQHSRGSSTFRSRGWSPSSPPWKTFLSA